MKVVGSAGAAALAVMVAAWGLPVAAADPLLPAGTRMYLSTDDLVSSARGGDDVGTIVRCRVWRDVEVNGVVFVKAGAPATCRVDKVSRRNMGGFQGKVAIGAVETRSVDGQNIILAGGYHKEGSGHKAVVWTVGLLVFWPALFIPGGNAELPPGTVFDVSTVNDLQLASATTPTARKLDLRVLGDHLIAEFLVDDFMNQPKHDLFHIKVAKETQLPDTLVIDNVNGKPVDPIPLALKDSAVKDGEASAIAEVSTKSLAKYFARGINRFEVVYQDGGERKSTEVVMDIQM